VYAVRKAAELREQSAWAIVISNPGLEELLSPLGFALAAALGGSPVGIYFQGPAVRVLTRSFSEHLPGWKRPFSGLARRGLDKAGHPPPHEKLRQLDDLGAQLYMCGPSMVHFKIKPDDLFLPGIKIVAYPTFVEQMNAAGVQVFVQWTCCRSQARMFPPVRQRVSSSARSAVTRRAISSRVRRTSSRGRPFGSGRSQSRYRLPGMKGH